MTWYPNEEDRYEQFIPVPAGWRVIYADDAGGLSEAPIAAFAVIDSPYPDGRDGRRYAEHDFNRRKIVALVASNYADGGPELMPEDVSNAVGYAGPGQTMEEFQPEAGMFASERRKQACSPRSERS